MRSKPLPGRVNGIGPFIVNPSQACIRRVHEEDGVYPPSSLHGPRSDSRLLRITGSQPVPAVHTPKSRGEKSHLATRSGDMLALPGSCGGGDENRDLTAAKKPAIMKIVLM
jgi:hypothetical protein